MELEPLTLGERIVMIARLMAAEHVRQVISEMRAAAMTEATVLAGTFNNLAPIVDDSGEIR